MRKLLLAAVATAAIASPASARDGSGYVGVDLGAMILENMRYDFEDADTVVEDVVRIDSETGYDLGLVGGYDFGLFRVEGELAYKRASIEDLRISGLPVDNVEDAFIDADGRHTALSAMANVIVDLGDENDWNGFLGAGVGLARVKGKADFSTDLDPTIPGTDFGFSDSDSVLAWQVLAGVRKSLSPNIDLGLKYRFFNTRKFEFTDGDTSIDSKWRSHSFMASLTYNFYTPPAVVEAPPPPPPPPPPPATQTCPDGSVILATETCPVPPPPPPPPPPAPERG